ncbi:MAG: hypothetical protein ABW105_03295 [Candidatus Thiodiazotropha sp. 6PLUC1]
MLFHNLTLDTINSRFEEIAATVINSGRTSIPVDPERSPAALRDAMHRLVEILQLVDKQSKSGDNDPLSSDELNELGDYGINLLMDFSALATDLKLTEVSHEFEDLSLPLALWLGRHLGQIRTIEPIVNALARLANTYSETAELEQLYEVAQELLQAIAPELKTGKSGSTSSEPWRILLINQAIIATRSHQPGLIDSAYETLTRYIPDEAPNFFKEGMTQMDALNYPQQVREVVEKYYNLWRLPRTLH